MMKTCSFASFLLSADEDADDDADDADDDEDDDDDDDHDDDDDDDDYDDEDDDDNNYDDADDDYDDEDLLLCLFSAFCSLLFLLPIVPSGHFWHRLVKYGVWWGKKHIISAF